MKLIAPSVLRASGAMWLGMRKGANHVLQAGTGAVLGLPARQNAPHAPREDGATHKVRLAMMGAPTAHLASTAHRAGLRQKMRVWIVLRGSMVLATGQL